MHMRAAEVILVCAAITLGEGQKAAGAWVAHGPEQVEQIARAVGHRRAGQQKDQPWPFNAFTLVVRNTNDF